MKQISPTPLVGWNKCYLTALFTFLCAQAFAQFTLTDNFRSSNVNNSILFGGNPNPAFLTSGIVDPVNNGWLRVTSATTNQQGYAYIKTSFTSSLGVLLDFEYKAWRSSADSYNGADGFSVFFFDADSTFSLGGDGGSLNYAPNTAATPAVNHGLAGGYLAVGLDEYGNFSNPTEGRVGGPGLSPNSIVLRGPTTNNPTTTNAYLAGFQIATSTTANAIDYNTVTSTRPSDATFYRRIQIQIVPSGGNYIVTVKWATTPNGLFTQLLTYTTTTPPPANLKVGFGAATGGGFNFHEMRNLIITTPGGVRLDKNVDKVNAIVGDQVTYNINAYNSAPAGINGLIFSDTLKDGNGNKITLTPSTFTINSITFNNNGNTGNTAAGYTNGTPVTSGFTNPFTTNLNLVANGTANFTVIGTINAIPAGAVLKNSAGLDPTPTGFSDPDTTNNYFTVNTNVLSPNVDFIVTKTLDKNCADPVNGNTYIITVSNNGVNSSVSGTGVSVTDNIPAGFSVSSVSGAGWTSANAGNLYTFTRNDVLASGFSYPPIGIKVIPPSSGTSWLNTATVTYAGAESNTLNNTSTITLYSNPGPSTVSSPVTYCIGATSSPLIATGNNLLWYNASSGIGYSAAPTPSTSAAGNTTYYVSQSSGTCVSDLSPITVTVNPNASLTLSSAPSTTNQTLTAFTAVTPITYTIGGSGTGATLTGQPSGVTGAFSSGIFTISGTPTSVGTFNYSATTSGGCSSASSGGVIQVSINLPVKYIDLTVNADNGRARLDWTTAIETNNTGFEIDRCSDGLTWTKIGFQPTTATNGNSVQPLSYTFYDNTPLNGVDLYRLKQIDLDGNADYSIILPIAFGGSSKISVSPNPANDMVVVKGINAGQVVRLVDLQGKILQEKMATGDSETFQISQLPATFYIVQIFSNGRITGSIKLSKLPL